MLDIFSIAIKAFQPERKIQVYLPKSYVYSNKKYPVLYMHDRQNVFRNDRAIGGVSLEIEKYLDAEHLDVIVVAIDQNNEERKNEYGPWANGAYSRIF